MYTAVICVGICCLQTAASVRPFIVGGTEVVIGSRPYQAAIFLFGSLTCGGALVGDRHVLTAKHCMGNSPHLYTVTLGMHDLDRKQGSPHDYRVAYIHNHNSADLSVVELSSAVDLNATYIWKVLLAPNDDLDYVGSDCYISGFGYEFGEGPAADRLQEAQLDTITNSDCRVYWGSRVTAGHVCALDKRSGSATVCNGDSGGPLSCIRDGRWHVVGVISEMSTGCYPSVPSVFVRVSQYHDWITKIIRK